MKKILLIGSILIECLFITGFILAADESVKLILAFVIGWTIGLIAIITAHTAKSLDKH